MNNSNTTTSLRHQDYACFTLQELAPDHVDSPVARAIFGVLYSLVLITGLAGNATVIVCLWQRLHFNVRRIFVLSLAMSDSLIGLTSLPITAVTIFSREWLFGFFVCKSIGFVQGSCIFISSFTLATIAIDRFFRICHPTSQMVLFCGPRVSLVSITCVWIAGSALAIPLALFMNLDKYSDRVCGEFCYEVWPAESYRLTYGILTLILQYGIPLLITTFCYYKISAQVSHQIQRRRQHEIILPEAERRLLKRRSCTNRMTFAMVLSFMLAYFPLNLLNMAQDLGFSIRYGSTDLNNIIRAFAHLFAMTSIIWNPIIYSWFHVPFRETISRILCFRASAAECTAVQVQSVQNDNVNANFLKVNGETQSLLPVRHATSAC